MWWHVGQATDPPRSKRFDLRNEGLFPFVFVLSGDTLDAECSNALLSATPPALLTQPAPNPKVRLTSQMNQMFKS
jgi:hypothetical protein